VPAGRPGGLLSVIKNKFNRPKTFLVDQNQFTCLPEVVDQNRIFSLPKTFLVDQKRCAFFLLLLYNIYCKKITEKEKNLQSFLKIFGTK
jgi:hypothetical protein